MIHIVDNFVDKDLFKIANDYLNTADGKYWKINDKGEITGGKPEARALMKTYLDTYNTILNNSDVRDYYAMDKEIGNISKNFNSKAIHDETQRIIMSRAINLDNTEWFDGKGDIKHIAIVPVKIMSLDNKIDGKSVNGQKVSGLYEEFLRTVVEDDGMIFPQMANLKDSQIVSTVQSDMNRNNSYYAGLFKDFSAFIFFLKFPEKFIISFLSIFFIFSAALVAALDKVFVTNPAAEKPCL